MNTIEKKTEILRKWAENAKNREDYPDSLRTLLRYAVLEWFREKFPEKSLISPENAFSEVLPYNFFLSSWFLRPEVHETEILAFAVAPELQFAENKENTLKLIEEDLREIPCPKASVAARLLLSALPNQTRVCFTLSERSQVENVPASLVADGHLIEKREKKANFWKIFVLKRGEVK